jgi:dTDP-glucose 4,6-dehydratase
MILKQGRAGETYNVGGNNEWENIALAKYICEQMDELVPRNQSYKSLLSFVTDRAGHDFRYAIDMTKINRELKWSPKNTRLSGLQKTIQFYLQTHEVPG